MLTLILALLAQPATAAQEPVRAPGSRIELRENAAIDLWFHVRAVAAGTGASPVEALAPAVAAARELHAELGPMSLRWGALEGLLAGCASAADLVRAMELAPETIEERGKTIPIRARGLAIARAIAAGEEACTELVAEHAYLTGTAAARWSEEVGPKESELLLYHQRRLGLEGLTLTIPVYLVAEGAPPGAVTYFDEHGRGVCFVGVAGAEGSELYELVLHEATHALDIATSASLFGELDAALAAAGVGPEQRARHDLPHLVMFLQAADSVRHVLAPDHEDYGLRHSVYARMGPRSTALRSVFGRYATDELTRADFVREFVAAR